MKKISLGAKGWVMCIYGLLCVFVSTAFKDSMNVAVMDFGELYGWDQTYLFSLASFGAYAFAIVSFLIGLRIAKGKVKMRPLILISGLTYAVTIGLWGVIGNLTAFTIMYIIMTIGYSVWMYQANSTLFANWYPKKVGYVMGIVTVGFAAGSAFGSVLYTSLRDMVGFQMTYFIYGVIVLAITLFGFFSFTEYPEESGRYPDNDINYSREAAKAELVALKAEEATSPWSIGRVLKCPQMWCIGVSIGVLVLVASGSMGQMVVRFMMGGIPIERAVTLMMIVGLANAVGSYLFGLLDTLANVSIAIKVCLGFMTIACILFSIDSFWTMIIGACMIGVALGAASNFSPSIVMHHWDRRSFNKVYSTTVFIQQGLGGFGAVSVANLANSFSYSVAFKVLAVVCVAALIWFFTIKKGFVAKYEAKFAKEDGQVQAS